MKKPLRAGRPRYSNGARPDRRLDLVRSAYDIIAREGFEKLRTRDIAARAGVNIATLHYYFPTKEALIGGVALHLARQFATRAEPPPGAGALQKLRHEFADVRFYLSERPDVIEVMRELNARAQRDRAIAAILTPLKLRWRKTIQRVIAAGVAEGVFRRDPPAGRAAAVVVAMLWGAATLPLDTVERECLFAAIESWLGTGTRGKTPRNAGAGQRARRKERT
jgi:AcrR family transcriptional regulator